MERLGIFGRFPGKKVRTPKSILAGILELGQHRIQDGQSQIPISLRKIRLSLALLARQE